MQLKTKIFYSITIISLGIWLGASIVRASIAFQLFEIGKAFQMNFNISNDKISQTIEIYTDAGAYTDISYILMLISIVILTVLNRKTIKQKGWLFMSIFLVVLFAPLELFLIYLDIILVQVKDAASIHANIMGIEFDSIRSLFSFRFLNPILKTISPLSFISNLAVLFILILRPLDRKEDS